MANNFQDVQAFHRKFGVGLGGDGSLPQLPPTDVYEFRKKFLHEELREMEEAYLRGDLPAYFDALLDLVYVAMGTADLSSLPWQAGWQEIQRANMAKMRAPSAEASQAATGRSHRLDVIKPPGWTPPNHAPALDRPLTCEAIAVFLELTLAMKRLIEIRKENTIQSDAQIMDSSMQDFLVWINHHQLLLRNSRP